MTFLPIAVRELRLASRRRATYWLRTGLAGSVIAICLFVMVAGTGRMPQSQIGPFFFALISGLALVFCMFAGIFLTADCLSEERREGTLGLLFLTQLRGYDVVLGKLLATSLPAIYGLLTIFPVLAVPLLMGGVSFAEFWRVVLALVTTLAFSLCMGLVISCFSREARQAMSSTLLLMVFFCGLSPLLAWMARAQWSMPLDMFYWASPSFLFTEAFDANFRSGGTTEFWFSWLTVGGLTMLALIMVHVRLPRSWQEGGGGRARRRLDGWMLRWRFGGAGFRAVRRALLDENPYYWLATRDRMPRYLAGFALGALFILWLGLVAGCFSGRFSTRNVSFGSGIVVALGLHLVAKWFVATESSRRLNEDRQSGALELLLVTPLPVKAILDGQRQAVRQAFLLPTIIAFACNLGLIILLVGPDPMRMGTRETPLFCMIILGGILLLFTDAYALTWTGMWMGLRSRGHHRAILATLGRVMVLPWVAILLMWFMAMNGVISSEEAAWLAFILWQLFGVFIDVSFAAKAREHLRTLLRPASRATLGSVGSSTVQ